MDKEVPILDGASGRPVLDPETGKPKTTTVKTTEEEICDMYFMNPQQVAELAKSGMEIGCHGYYHNPRDGIKEYEKTVGALNNILSPFGSRVRCMSYPHGSYIAGLEGLGIEVAFTTVSKTIQLGAGLGNPLTLPRINITDLPSIRKQNSHNKKIVVMSTSDQGKHIALHLCKNGLQPSHIVTMSKTYAEENNVCDYVDHSAWVNDFNSGLGSESENQIKLYYFTDFSLKHDNDIEFFKDEEFDLMILAGWSPMVPKSIIDTLKIGGLGQHGSSEVLPRGRGRATTNWGMINGSDRLTWNIFFITPRADDGLIVDTRVYGISEYDTIKTLYLKHGIAVKRMLASKLPEILEKGEKYGELLRMKHLANSKLDVSLSTDSEQKNLELRKTREHAARYDELLDELKLDRNDNEADQGLFINVYGVNPSFFPKRNPVDGEILWGVMYVKEIYNLVRAVTRPYPGAYTFNGGVEKVMVWSAVPFESSFLYPKAKVGEVVEDFGENEGFLVNCSDGNLLVTDWTASKRPYIGDLLQGNWGGS